MRSEQYQKLKQEIQEKQKGEKYSYGQRTILEQQIFKDLLGQGAYCRKCNKKDGLTLEHIVPKDILKTFGIDTDREIVEGNYSVTCKVCNSFKGNRLDFSIPATKEILLELIQKI